MKYLEMSKEELSAVYEELSEEYRKWQAKGLKLDMSRGKPGPEQLDLSEKMLDELGSNGEPFTISGTDCRNYGVIDGIPEAKHMMADIMGTVPENVIIFGNSSLKLMYDTVARAFIYGIDGHTPWHKLDDLKFLCPAPGYDRHFRITEKLGFKLITIPMNDDGPDMNMVRKYVESDPSVKGIWCVPKYSNPLGITYSDEVVRAFAALKPAAEDFRIFWDNAYAVHDLYNDRKDELADILEACEKAGNPDMVYEFSSTSKISFPGGGISAFAASEKNRKEMIERISVETIGYDKLNQLRHARFFNDFSSVKEHMSKLADLIRPKFQVVLKVLDEELSEAGVGSWTDPNGGYFISFDAMDGCAGDIVKCAADAGVVMTDAGATYPYGNDPKDCNIRIAPTFPSIEELEQAAKLFALCVKLVSVKKLLGI